MAGFVTDDGHGETGPEENSFSSNPISAPGDIENKDYLLTRTKQNENFIRMFTLNVQDENSSEFDVGSAGESSETPESHIFEDERNCKNSSLLQLLPEKFTRRIISSDSCNSEDEDHKIEQLLQGLKERFNFGNSNTEGRVSFKANPVPIHCQELIFGEKLLDNSAETRQKRIKELSSVRPSRFTSSQLKRINSAPILSETETELAKIPHNFRAKPVPKFILSNLGFKEKARQEEEFRRLKIKIRSEEMLRTSVSPIFIRSKSVQEAQAVKPEKFKQICTKYPPDFKSLHFKLAKELGGKKSKNMSTICQPFNLSKSCALRQNSPALQVVRSPDKVQCISRRNTSPIPTKMTKTARLRVDSSKQKQENLDRPVLKAGHKKSPSTRRKMAMKFELNSPFPTDVEEKISQLKKIDKERNKEYKKQITEMKKRVEIRPLLVERQALENAKKSAEKKFNEKLKAFGVSQSFIEKASKNHNDDRIPSPISIVQPVLDSYSSKPADDQFEGSPTSSFSQTS